MRKLGQWIAGMGLPAALFAALPILAQTPSAPPQGPVLLGDGTFLLTIFLKHDQSRPLGKLNE